MPHLISDFLSSLGTVFASLTRPPIPLSLPFFLATVDKDLIYFLYFPYLGQLYS